MGVQYFAAFDDEGTPLGLFRVSADDDRETLDMEFLTADGTWKNDPTVIDEIREPGVTEVQASDVPDLADALTGGKEAEGVADHAAADAAEKGAVAKQRPSERASANTVR